MLDYQDEGKKHHQDEDKTDEKYRNAEPLKMEERMLAPWRLPTY